MKTVVSIFFLFLFAHTMSASCGSGFVFYPKNQLVHQNTQIIIEAYGFSEYYTILKELDKKHPIYLKSKNRKIKLSKERLIEGQYGLHQAIFKLDEYLVEGETYILHVENLAPKNSTLFTDIKQTDLNGQYKHLKWTATNQKDNSPPKVTSSIKFINSQINIYGCGSAIHSKYSCSVKDNSEVFILTEVVDIESDSSFQYYLPLEKNTLLVGHDMCTGAFRFDESKNFKIRFKVYDISGNTTNHWTDWLAFDNP